MAIGGRDPGDEHVVGMVGEMISGEGVDEVVLVAEVRSGNGDQLTVAGRRRYSPGSGDEVVSVGCEERGGNQDHRIVAGS